MEKKRLFDILYIAMILSLIAFLIFLYFFMKSNATACLSNPIDYYEKKTTETFCTCIKNPLIYEIKQNQKDMDNG